MTSCKQSQRRSRQEVLVVTNLSLACKQASGQVSAMEYGQVRENLGCCAETAAKQRLSLAVWHGSRVPTAQCKYGQVCIHCRVQI